MRLNQVLLGVCLTINAYPQKSNDVRINTSPLLLTGTTCMLRVYQACRCCHWQCSMFHAVHEKCSHNRVSAHCLTNQISINSTTSQLTSNHHHEARPSTDNSILCPTRKKQPSSLSQYHKHHQPSCSRRGRSHHRPILHRSMPWHAALMGHATFLSRSFPVPYSNQQRV